MRINDVIIIFESNETRPEVHSWPKIRSVIIQIERVKVEEGKLVHSNPTSTHEFLAEF